MIKVIEIIKIENFNIACLLNNGTIKNRYGTNVNKAQTFKRNRKLHNLEIFSQAKIGLLGEILWGKIITSEHNGEVNIWDYDISPELVLAEGKEYKIIVASLKILT